MTELSEGFEHYLVPDEDEIRLAITTGLVVLDSNVLLETYRFANDAREQLLTVLNHIGDRLWIPHQVRLEFHRNRLKVMSSRDEAYEDVLKVIGELRQSQASANAKIRGLANRVLLPKKDRDELLNLIGSGLDESERRMVELRDAHPLGGSYANDPVLVRLQKIFCDGRVGPPLSEDELIRVREEALRRVEAKEPPGYMDNDKDDSTGDYLIWYQTLKEAVSRRVPLLLVTRDAKEDWFLRIKGQTVCGRPELIQEAASVAGIRATIMQTQSLLFHARAYLKAAVSEETLRQARLASKQRPTLIPALMVKTRFLERMHEIVSRELNQAAAMAADLREQADISKEALERELDQEDTHYSEGQINGLIAVLKDTQARVDRLAEIEAILNSRDHSALSDMTRLVISSRDIRERVVRLAEVARRSFEKPGTRSEGDAAVLDTAETADVLLGDGTRVAIAMSVTHGELGEGRIASVRHLKTGAGTFAQVCLFLNDGGVCWVTPQDLRCYHGGDAASS